ncbi:hypothetical protein Mal4_08980 [Maioricimonas rarisocia]|uniref:Uncharacterized protein n=1 Tax=Maioricimonas rarisocia TaxID=2528026 RepID=A0A517Z2A8_9PLAN|nr:hypothetical protein [Maioricimonas rarisocia]QDU36611.1 hypothetical protein Mal4_08980 [Maioricimonas rarisocia]
MTRSHIAFVLSFVLPGAGLCYAGHCGWALLNFAVAVVITVLAWYSTLTGAHDSVLYVWLALAAGSAGLAHAQTEDEPRKKE